MADRLPHLLRAIALLVGLLGSLGACDGEARTSAPPDATAGHADQSEAAATPDAADARVPILGSYDAGFADVVNPPPHDLPEGSCGSEYFETVADAAPHACAFTRDDVACDADTDCVTFQVPICGCPAPVRGVNKTSSAGCIGPPCAPPRANECPAGFYFETQDCRTEKGPEDIAVACVDQECITYAGN